MPYGVNKLLVTSRVVGMAAVKLDFCWEKVKICIKLQLPYLEVSDERSGPERDKCTKSVLII